ISLGVFLIFGQNLAAATYTYDLGIEQSGIFFSTSRLISGDTIRIYARIRNHGSEDVAGYVSFHKGGDKVGDSQVISVRAGGLEDEVYVDFVVPSGSFNIRAEIKGQDPLDENPANDVAVTTMFYPEIDDDDDGIPNDDDNCPNDANAEQEDNDDDGIGDACDIDDDNDTWSDEREQDEGTSPTDPDTDGDGYNDPDDDYPLDPSRHEVPAPPGPQEPEQESPPEQEPGQTADDQEAANQEDEEDEDVAESEEEEEVATQEESLPFTLENLQISPRASFSYRKIKWNEYEFQALGALRKNLRYEWDFGDGAVDNQEKVVHAFGKSGEYLVKLKVIDLVGQSAEDEVKISISFFNLENWRLWTLVGGIVIFALAVLMILGLLSKARLKKWNQGQSK
ncbi:PKD domain-containing protein, partial [Patescibacteria group bacterium]|nr:PKD domain-containing protein [Patescibacteria group bacterium]MBU1921972.1 PKD domain-containing protein [Patescibacteria group bacterium]